MADGQIQNRITLYFIVNSHFYPFQFLIYFIYCWNRSIEVGKIKAQLFKYVFCLKHKYMCYNTGKYDVYSEMPMNKLRI